MSTGFLVEIHGHLFSSAMTFRPKRRTLESCPAPCGLQGTQVAPKWTRETTIWHADPQINQPLSLEIWWGGEPGSPRIVVENQGHPQAHKQGFISF